jgi:hypothetical protein
MIRSENRPGQSGANAATVWSNAADFHDAKLPRATIVCVRAGDDKRLMALAFRLIARPESEQVILNYPKRAGARESASGA